MGDFDFLSDEERELFHKIIRDAYSMKKRATKPKQIREIVPIEEWVNSEYYVGLSGMGLYDYWKKQLIEMFSTETPSVNEGIITGGLGCRPLDTFYDTFSGRLSMKEIKDRIQSEVIMVRGEFGDRKKIVDVHYVGKKRCKKVVFSNGFEMVATNDHRIRIWDKKGEYTWCRFDRLTTKTQVALVQHGYLTVVYPVTIKNAGAMQCGDIEVEGHVYINDGLINHNTGKSTFAVFCLIRKLYELSCWQNIPALFGLMPNSIVSFFYFSVSKTQAEITGFGQIRNIVDSIPYFREKFPRNERIQSMLIFPENLMMLYGSSASHSIGMNMIGSILDEANFFQGDAQNPEKSAVEYSKVSQMYSAIVNRSASRFMTNGRDDSLSLLVSSNTTSSSFVDRRIKEQMGKKNVKIVNARLWETKPKGTYSDKGFWVFIGNDTIDPFIVETIADLKMIMDGYEVVLQGEFVEEQMKDVPPTLQYLFTWVPEDFRDKYDNNVVQSLQDISGISVAPSGRLFNSRIKYREACETTLEHPFSKPEIILSTNDSLRIFDYIKKGYRPFKKDKPRYLHFDQSTTNDSTGIGSSYLDSYMVDPRTGISKPVVATDLLIRVNPPKPPNKISISKCRELVYMMQRYWGLTIGYVSYDQFQSSESLQELEENGIPCGRLSVDRTDEQYLTFVNMLYEGRIKSYYHKKAEEELFELIHYRDRHKVDHPDGGCFMGNTLVYTVKGKRTIEQLEGKPEDIITYDSKSGVFKAVRTEGSWKTKVVQEHALVVVGSDYISCTPDHRFLTTAGWIKAQFLKGYKVITYAGLKECRDVNLVKCEPTWVYDLEVPETHNFLVAGGEVVHNSKDVMDGWVGSVWNVLTHTHEETMDVPVYESGVILDGGSDDFDIFGLEELIGG